MEEGEEDYEDDLYDVYLKARNASRSFDKCNLIKKSGLLTDFAYEPRGVTLSNKDKAATRKAFGQSKEDPIEVNSDESSFVSLSLIHI